MLRDSLEKLFSKFCFKIVLISPCEKSDVRKIVSGEEKLFLGRKKLGLLDEEKIDFCVFGKQGFPLKKRIFEVRKHGFLAHEDKVGKQGFSTMRWKESYELGLWKTWISTERRNYFLRKEFSFIKNIWLWF